MKPGLFFAFLVVAFSSAHGSTQVASATQADRVVASPDARVTTRLAGHVPGWADSANDLGAVAPGTSLQLTLVLSRSPEVQASFAQLLADQQNAASANYHHWLTPQQVGERFGPTQHDVDALTTWLGSQGLSVVETAPSRMFVKVAGPASIVGSALATSFHSFSVNGHSRMATTVDPSIPSAFASVVSSITGLADTDLRPMSRGQGMAKPTANGTGGQPQYGSISNGAHYVAPSDFAVIFDLNPVYNGGINGAGQKVAIIGRSRVAPTDISEYESQTGLPSNPANVIIPATGADPGTTNDDDQAEATLDVERLIGTAPGVKADLVVNSSASGGIFTAAQYEVQTVLDPVMTISFGSCEFYAGASQVSAWDTLFSQAASEGISVFVSSGDAGAAGCDTQFATPPMYQIRSINYICASSYATCAGGTEFVEGGDVPYWASNNGSNLESALSYIPEGAWNEPQDLNVAGQPYVAFSGGGGASIYVPKPGWQTGTGVPADNARDVPDVSFPSSQHDAYYGCYAAGNGDCGANRFYFYFGTSAAAPSLAAVTALLNQKTGGTQGNLNPLLYRLAASNPNAFHDATPLTIYGVVCFLGTASVCNNTTPSPSSLSGGLTGYALTAGYDQATGLGSLDVANFLTAAAAASKPTLVPTVASVQESASTISNTQTVVFTAVVTSQTAGTPTGTVQFYADGNAIGAPAAVASGTAVSAALPLTAAGMYSISASYSGDGTYAAAVSPGIPLTVTGAASVTAVTVATTAIPVGTSESFSISVFAGSGTGLGTGTPTGVVRVSVTAPNVDILFSVPLLNGTATTPAITLPTVGSYTVTASYHGDTVFSPSSGTGPAIAVQRLAPVLQVSLSQGNIGIGGGTTVGFFVPGFAGSTAPGATGTIQLYSNGVALGTPFALPPAVGPSVQGAFPVSVFTTAGTYTITASYSGDAYWQPATSQGMSLTVESTPAFYQLSLFPTTKTLQAGDVENNVEPVNIASELGFVGTVNVSCSVTYNGPGTVAGMPTCSLSPGSVTFPLSIGIPSSEPVLTIHTTARSGSASGLSADGGSQRGGWHSAGEALACALLLWLAPVRRRSWRALVILMVFGAGFTALSGCGGSAGSTTPVGTTAGSYTVTITPSTTAAGARVAPATLALTIT
jgi:pseudomonalisin